MNNKSKDIFKILIPVLAVVIVIESILVVSRLNSSTNDINVAIPAELDSQSNTEVEIPKQVDAKASFVFSTEDNQIDVGEKKKVTLEILPKEDFSLDALDLYIGYDIGSLEVSGLREESGLEATSKKVSDKKGVILTNFWFMEEDGYKFDGGKPVKLVSFDVKPKVAGVHEFSILELGDELTQMVSNVDGESVIYGFSSEKLIIRTGE